MDLIDVIMLYITVDYWLNNFRFIQYNIHDVLLRCVTTTTRMLCK